MTGTAPERLFVCSAAARWLPRAMAGAVLAAAMFAAFRIEAAGEPLLPMVRRFIVVAGALFALGVVRKGSEVRCRFGLTTDALVVLAGSREYRLELARVHRLDYAGPFAGSLSWLPAAVLIDLDGGSWRIPALVHEGDELLAELLRRAGRHDLDSWAEAYRIVSRMGRYRYRIRLGYCLAASVFLVGVGYYFH